MQGGAKFLKQLFGSLLPGTTDLSAGRQERLNNFAGTRCREGHRKSVAEFRGGKPMNVGLNMGRNSVHGNDRNATLLHLLGD